MSETECPACGAEFDADEAATDGDLIVCPECGEALPDEE